MKKKVVSSIVTELPIVIDNDWLVISFDCYRKLSLPFYKLHWWKDWQNSSAMVSLSLDLIWSSMRIFYNHQHNHKNRKNWKNDFGPEEA